MSNIDYGAVMHKFYAGRQYGVRGPAYEDITWLEEKPKPSQEHLAGLWEEIKDQEALRKLHESRSMPGEYPSKDDLIVALWEKVVEGKSDYADELQARRQAIKSKYPKG